MTIDINGSNSSIEFEQQKREATRKRFIKLLGICAVALIVRLVIKDPAPPKAPDHSDKPMRFVPGMLQNIPLSEQQKLKPDVLAKLIEADRLAVSRQKGETTEGAKGPYKPLVPVLANLKDDETAKDYNYQYKKRQLAIETAKEAEIKDTRKATLVKLANGRYLIAENAMSHDNTLSIRIDKTLVANVPSKLIDSVSGNALTWKEPVPMGYKKIKPAKGITVILKEETARRITSRKSNDES